MKHTTTTALAIDSAIRTTGGDFYALSRATGRFATEALVDAAEQALESLTSSERERFASTVSSEYRHDRDWAIRSLCSYRHAQRIREFRVESDRARAAANADFAAAYESLGAAL